MCLYKAGSIASTHGTYTTMNGHRTQIILIKARRRIVVEVDALGRKT